MENGLKGLTLAAGVIITCLVVSIGFFITREAKDIAVSGVNQMGYYTEEMSNSGIEFYSGMTISGSEVERAIKRLYDSCGIWINQKNNTKVYLDSTVADIEATINALEINSYGTFEGTIEYDEKGKIKWMIFNQV